MSTRGQVVDPYFVSAATATPDPERAAVVRPSLRPKVPVQWWWGSASSAIASGAPKAGAPGATPPAPGLAPSSSGCCGG